MTGPSLTEFLLARIADDETWVRASWNGTTGLTDERWWRTPIQPSHLLAEAEAKREIVRYYEQLCANAEVVEDPFHYHSTGLLYAVRTHAAAYADHPDYDEAWRP